MPIKMQTPGYVYLLTSKNYGTLYIGVTSDLISRIENHKKRLRPGFTARYKVDRLVYYEWYERIGDAIEREKQLKKWKRKWKIELIEGVNPTWRDLSYDLL